MEDLFSGLGSSCIVAGKRSVERPHSVQYSVVFKCLEPDSLYKYVPTSRPLPPVYSLTICINTARRLCFGWGEGGLTQEAPPPPLFAEADIMVNKCYTCGESCVCCVFDSVLAALRLPPPRDAPN